MSLTVITPTLNRSTLQRTIDSIRNQTVPATHLIRYDMLGLGAPKLRNQMVKEVKTSWVGFCDDDDWLDPRYHEWLKEANNADMVIFQMQRPDGMVLPGHTDTEKLAYNWVGISFALKTSIAKRFLFKDVVGEDFDLIERVRKSHRVLVVPQVAYLVGR